MRVSQVLTEKTIIKLVSKTKGRVLKEMVEVLCQNGTISEKDKVLRATKERESQESTCLGFGVAMPHARCEEIKSLAMVLGRSKDGVDFSSRDGKPVHLVFLVIAPPALHEDYLKLISRLARVLKSQVLRDRLMNAETAHDCLEAIQQDEQIGI